MSLEEIATSLMQAGCPQVKSMEMARQLDKRAQQLATQKGQGYEQAMTHLLALMKQGWAAQQGRPGAPDASANAAQDGTLSPSLPGKAVPPRSG